MMVVRTPQELASEAAALRGLLNRKRSALGVQRWSSVQLGALVNRVAEVERQALLLSNPPQGPV